MIRALREAGYEPVIVAPEDPVAEARMRELAVERIALRIDRAGLNPWADFCLMTEYCRLLRGLQPVAYLSYTIKPNVYGALAAASLGIPAVPNVSGLGTAFIRRGPIQHIVTKLYRIAFRRVPVVFFQNAEDRALFVERRIVRADQAHVLPGSGVDLSFFTPTAPRTGPPAFLLIGRMLRDKGVIEFVEAARLLRTKLPEARFQLLGPIDPGNRTAISKVDLDSWAKEGVVEYLGATNDVRPFITEASAVVLPSYREGLPRSLLEAAAMERPLIASDVPGCRDVVQDGINGFLCQVRSSASLADAILKMAELSGDQRLRMAKRARKKVEQEFSEQIVIRTYLDVLASVAGT